MSSIEDLREKYGDTPTKLRSLKFSAGGHTFIPYLVRVNQSTTKRRAQISLRDGSTVEIDVNAPEESEVRNGRAYFQVDGVKDVLYFFESEQHVSDYLECQRSYALEQERLIKAHLEGIKNNEERLRRAQTKHDKLEASLEKAAAEFRLGFATDVRLAKLQELSADVSKWRGRLRAAEKGAAKPDKSFVVAVRMNAPIKVQFPSGFVDPADNLQSRLFDKFGVVPVKSQTITVLGILKSSVVLKK